jgi:hypothetical protein
VSLLHRLLENKSEDIFRKIVPMDSGLYKRVRSLYWTLK